MSEQTTTAATKSTKSTRSPSKTRHLSAQRLQKIENCVSLLQMSANGKDKATKEAAITLALAYAAEVSAIDAEIVKVQSAS